jgi:hypothetical protein
MKNEDRLKLADNCIDNSNGIDSTKEQIKKLDMVFKDSKKYIPIRIGILLMLGGFYFLFKLFF